MTFTNTELILVLALGQEACLTCLYFSSSFDPAVCDDNNRAVWSVRTPGTMSTCGVMYGNTGRRKSLDPFAPLRYSRQHAGTDPGITAAGESTFMSPTVLSSFCEEQVGSIASISPRGQRWSPCSVGPANAIITLQKSRLRSRWSRNQDAGEL